MELRELKTIGTSLGFPKDLNIKVTAKTDGMWWSEPLADKPDCQNYSKKMFVKEVTMFNGEECIYFEHATYASTNYYVSPISEFIRIGLVTSNNNYELW